MFLIELGASASLELSRAACGRAEGLLLGHGKPLVGFELGASASLELSRAACGRAEGLLLGHGKPHPRGWGAPAEPLPPTPPAGAAAARLLADSGVSR